MKVVLFGATGMVGQAVLRECLQAPEVERVLALVRTATGRTQEKLRELLVRDFTDFSAVEGGIGRAMIRVAARGAPKRVLESREIDLLGA